MSVTINLPNGNKHVIWNSRVGGVTEVCTDDGACEGVVFSCSDLYLSDRWSGERVELVFVRMSAQKFRDWMHQHTGVFDSDGVLGIEPYRGDPYIKSLQSDRINSVTGFVKATVGFCNIFRCRF